MCCSAQEHVQSQCTSQYIRAKVNSSHLMKKKEQARDALIKAQKQLVLKESELQEGEQQIEEIEISWRNYEKAAREKVSRERDIQLDGDQVRFCKDSLHCSNQSCV